MPSSLCARCNPTKDRWLKPRSLSPPMSVTRPTFFPEPLPLDEVVPDEFLLPPPPPQPATRRPTKASSASDLFIPTLSARVCDYGAKTVREPISAHPTTAHVSLAVVLRACAGG